MKIDIKRNDTPSTQVEYQIINPENGEILDLSLCNNIKIDIYAPVNFSQDYLDLIKQLKKQGYDIFNSEDSFYNDICATFNSENETDIIIKDRKNDFYNPNLSLCEENCEYKSFDINSSKVKCECEIKTEIKSDISYTKFSPNIILENFYNFDKYTNYKVLKCYSLVFDLNKLKKNYGSYILTFIILIFIIVMIINIITQNDKYMKILDEIININIAFDKKLKKKKNKTKNKEKEKDQRDSEIIKKRILFEPNDETENKENIENKKNKKKKVLFSLVNNYKSNNEQNKNSKNKNNIYFSQTKSNRNYSRNKNKNEDIINEHVRKIFKTDERKKPNPPKKKPQKNKKINNFELNIETNGENKLTCPRNKKNKNNKNMIKEYKTNEINKKGILKKNKKHFNIYNTNEDNTSSHRAININNSGEYETNLINLNIKKNKNKIDENNTNN